MLFVNEERLDFRRPEHSDYRKEYEDTMSMFERISKDGVIRFDPNPKMMGEIMTGSEPSATSMRKKKILPPTTITFRQNILENKKDDDGATYQEWVEWRWSNNLPQKDKDGKLKWEKQNEWFGLNGKSRLKFSKDEWDKAFFIYKKSKTVANDKYWILFDEVDNASQFILSRRDKAAVEYIILGEPLDDEQTLKRVALNYGMKVNAKSPSVIRKELYTLVMTKLSEGKLDVADLKKAVNMGDDVEFRAKVYSALENGDIYLDEGTMNFMYKGGGAIMHVEDNDDPNEALIAFLESDKSKLNRFDSVIKSVNIDDSIDEMAKNDKERFYEICKEKGITNNPRFYKGGVDALLKAYKAQ